MYKVPFVIVGMLVLSTINASLRAEESPETLIKKLSSDDFEERERANKDLIKLGSKARDAIAATLQQPGLDADIATRLKLIQEKLGHVDVLIAFDSPKRINLDLKDVSVGDALAKVEQHFEIQIPVEKAAAEKKISANVKEATLFEAIEMIRSTAGLCYDMKNRVEEGDSKVLQFQLMEHAKNSAVPAYANAYLLLFINSITENTQRQFTVSTGKSDESSSIQIHGQILTDPMLNFSTLSVAEPELKDASGKVIQGTISADQETWRSKSAGQVFRFWMHAQVKNGEIKLPLSLKLSANIEIPLRMGEKRIDNVAGSKGKQIDLNGGSVTITGLEQKNNGWEFSVSGVGIGMELLNDSGGMRTWGRLRGRAAKRIAAIQNDEIPAAPKNTQGFFILDANGNPIDRNGYSGSGNGKKYDVTLTLESEPKSILMRWVEEKADRKIPLELKDIPVP